MSTESMALSSSQKATLPIESSTVQRNASVLADAYVIPLASLDGSLAGLHESLEKLNVAKSVNIVESIDQLKMASESARVVRELVWAELPEASWQNREELVALFEKIRKISDARILGQLRSRLLALATELEGTRVVHRRAHRVDELNRLRGQAIDELRSQAELQEAPPTLPGPEAEQWMKWACSLQEPRDLEPLEALRNGYAHLDDFVANLEPNMWIAGKPPMMEIGAESEGSADKSDTQQSTLETSRPEEPVISSRPTRILAAFKASGECDKPTFPDLPDERSSSVLESNTFTPNDVSQPRTAEAIQNMQKQEQALLASMMGLVSNSVGHFNPSVGRRFATESVHEMSAAPAITSNVRGGVQEPWVRKLRELLTTPTVLLVAALLLLLVLAAIVWRSRANHNNNGPVKGIEKTVSDLTRNEPMSQDHDQSRGLSVASVHIPDPTVPLRKEPKTTDQNVSSKPLSKRVPAKLTGSIDTEVSRPSLINPQNVATVEKEVVPSNTPAEKPGSTLEDLPSGIPTGAASIIADVPVPQAKVAAQQKITVSSGVAEALLVHQVTPKYPPMARQAGIGGTVVLRAVIGKDGTIHDLQVVSGHTVLTEAAIDAVKQWRYKPYYLNGEPVEADTQIKVNFTR